MSRVAQALSPLALSLAFSLALSLFPGTVQAGPPPVLERAWCTGISPVSWGFALTPPSPASEVRLRVLSPGVSILAARPGPDLDGGWKVDVASPQEVVITGSRPLTPRRRREAWLIVETDKAAEAISRSKVSPVRWEVQLGDGAPTPASFPPVLDLSEAVKRGLAIATLEPRSPLGDVELTVDNPTRGPVWLDVPPGSVVKVGAVDWVVGHGPPFRMNPRQRFGRTVTVFPLKPLLDANPPAQVRFRRSPGRPMTDVAELGLAASELRELAESGPRRPGRFENLAPFEFWPIVVKWASWDSRGQAPPDVLAHLVGTVLETRRTAGDPLADELTLEDALAEVEKMVSELERLRTRFGRGNLPVAVRASLDRFR